jgi:sugar lactone lactonase YvrE
MKPEYMKKISPLFVGFGLLAINIASGQSIDSTFYTFNTIAGVADGNVGSNDGTNNAARFFGPEGIAVDNAGNLYVADTFNDIIRKLTPVGTNWVVTTIAGTASAPGFNDGTNTFAQFDSPIGIALDSAGNLYVADTDNHTIRKLTPAGTNWVVSTIAGTAEIYGDSDGTNLAAQFYYPAGITVDNSNNLFVADTDNNAVRKLTPIGTNWITRTIAGTTDGSSGSADGTSASFFGPSGIALDINSNLYVTDTGNNTIRKIAPAGTNWVVSTIVGKAGVSGFNDGTNFLAQFSNPIGISMDRTGNLYVADSDNNTIRNITPLGTNWVTSTLGGIAGTSGSADGAGTNALFNLPYDVAVDGTGNLYVADASNNTIRMGRTAAVTAVPNLTVRFAAPNSVVVSWPNLGSYTLQTNKNLTVTNWANYGGAITTANSTNSITVSPPMGNLFFRLTN